MSTRSNIGYVEDGKAKVVYCHSDGYLEWNGKLLFKHFNSLEKAKEIVVLGDLSFLEEKLYPSDGIEHSFDKRESGVTVACHRDRGEELEINEYEVSKTNPLEDLKKLNSFTIEYVYIFYQNQWWVKHISVNHFVLLKDELNKLKD
ncbi:hypothetical protein [Campylobacter sp. MIT 97-5078]|uniref:hypothetical protein n=1 Tax=Campylobacter sp. MIT 97-5078 TaxID=1548153 RepID=UPI000558F553|nr:hypothetical protein [Campylobacter sp. MIT 97-5078]TQR27433.1 hypothetical protein DMB91_04035 [Campylobacter sp. MIT 97-5078]